MRDWMSRKRLETSAEGDEIRAVRTKVARMVRARQETNSIFKTLVHVGALGWVFVLPIVLGLVAGRAMGGRTGAVVGLLLGVLFGGFAVYWNLRRSLHDDEKHAGADKEES